VVAVSPVDQLKAVHDELLAYLSTEPSLGLSTGAVMAKAILLAGASELEYDIVRIIVDYYDEITRSNLDATEFVAKKALARQYHQLFGWDGNNANSFFGFFGSDFKAYAMKAVRDDAGLDANIRGFLQLGRARNELVHENFAAYSLTLTVDEIVALYAQATAFRDALPGLLRRTV
jgi:hypothetical protein